MDHLEESSDNLFDVKAPMTAIGGEVGAAIDDEFVDVEDEDGVEAVDGALGVVAEDAAATKGVGGGAEPEVISWEDEEFGVS